MMKAKEFQDGVRKELEQWKEVGFSLFEIFYHYHRGNITEWIILKHFMKILISVIFHVWSNWKTSNTLKLGYENLWNLFKNWSIIAFRWNCNINLLKERKSTNNLKPTQILIFPFLGPPNRSFGSSNPRWKWKRSK